MKVLFANPAYRIEINSRYERYFFCAGSRCPWSLVKLKNELPRYGMFPFFMAYAAAILDKHGYKVDAIDGSALNYSQNEFLTYCIRSRPNVILFEPATTSISYILSFSEILKKETGALIVFAGSHSTVFANEILSQNSHISAILLNEYDYTFLGYLNYLTGKENIENVDGIAFKTSSNQIKLNQKTKYFNLDDLPFPARHLFPSKVVNDLSYYHDGFCQNRPAVQMHSSRGCPFRCNFCLWTQTIYKQGQYRIFSAERIVKEMQEIKENYKAKEIYFDDDTFTAKKDHVLSVCAEIKKQKVEIPWSAMGDAICTDEEMLYTVKDAGCIGMKFGLESASQQILKNIKKPVNPEKLKDLLKICRKLRIKTHITVSLGHIGETAETMKYTMRFVSKLDVDSVQFSLATPYPGTNFYEYVTKNGLLTAQNWEDYDPTYNPIVKHKNISYDYLKKTEAKSHGRWLRKKITNPSWIFSQLYFLIYLLRKQGLIGFISRLNRAIDILFSSQFK